MATDAKIKIINDGPYMVSGGVKLTQKIMENFGHHREYCDGLELPQNQTYALCRCGHSQNMPFCDGSHVDAHFDGAEIAETEPFDARADIIEGPSLDLYDDGRCAYARFCHREDGDVWTLTENSNDDKLRAEAILASTDCPAGRLVHHDKRNAYQEIEPELEPEIQLLEDPEQKCSAPLYVKGGIRLESSLGFEYEPRNRYALCRCGGSQNKPFCDAIHVNLGFSDGLKR